MISDQYTRICKYTKRTNKLDRSYNLSQKDVMVEYILLSPIFPPHIEFAIVDMETKPIDNTKCDIACFCNTKKHSNTKYEKYYSQWNWRQDTKYTK